MFLVNRAQSSDIHEENRDLALRHWRFLTILKSVQRAAKKLEKKAAQGSSKRPVIMQLVCKNALIEVSPHLTILKIYMMSCESFSKSSIIKKLILMLFPLQKHYCQINIIRRRDQNVQTKPVGETILEACQGVITILFLWILQYL